MEDKQRELMFDFGAALRAARIKRGLEIKTVAAACALSDTQVQGLESNDRSAFYADWYAARAARRYASYLGVPVSEADFPAPESAVIEIPTQVSASMASVPVPLLSRTAVRAGAAVAVLVVLALLVPHLIGAFRDTRVAGDSPVATPEPAETAPAVDGADTASAAPGEDAAPAALPGAAPPAGPSAAESQGPMPATNAQPLAAAVTSTSTSTSTSIPAAAPHPPSPVAAPVAPPAAAAAPVPKASAASAPAPALPAAAPAPPPPVASPAAAARGAPETRLFLQVFHDVGVTVKDSRGVILLQGRQDPFVGRSFTGTPPFTVIATDSDGVAVFYRGNRIRLARKAMFEWRADFGPR